MQWTMRVFALSDIHVDYEQNRRWLANLSTEDYSADILVLAGDVSDSLQRLEWAIKTLVLRFKKVLFVPGNHDLWVIRDGTAKSSFQKFTEVCSVARDGGALTDTLHHDELSIVPILGWYDYSFGPPTERLREIWMDYYACNWQMMTNESVAAHFAALNPPETSSAGTVITFSHFLPRIDVMPRNMPADSRLLFPVLGSALIEAQLRTVGSSIHVYGHSHVNREVRINGVRYVNNAFGYPGETWIASKTMLSIYEA